ncbi:MAG: DUF2851 family protein [Bacteroidaceae bacterium]|nr:DUF2851 family protein [Bacteroidaceae bacterium]
MKGLLHYIWENGLLPETRLHTTAGEELRIISPGTPNAAEPKLFNDARIEIDGRHLCGSVMLHDGTQDGHLGLFDSNNGCQVMLHVSLEKIYPTPANNTPLLHVDCSGELIQEFQEAQKKERQLPCGSTIAQLPATEFHDILSHLLEERFKEKRRIIERIFQQCDQRWDDTLLKVAIRSFGFGIQSDVFEKWASMLSTNALGKHSDNLTQIEAIFFGQAGLLEDASIPYYYRNEATQSAYYNELKREYDFLRNKFNLATLNHSTWGNGSTSPHLRIARLAKLYYLKRITISSIIAAHTLTDLYKLFNHSLDGYWQNHTCFGGTETCGNGCMRQKQVDILIINSVIPMLYIYGKHRKDERQCEKAGEWLHQIDCEENSIIKKWREQGVKTECAADSQAMLHLHRNYCKTNDCINCRFAYHYIKNRLK